MSRRVGYVPTRAPKRSRVSEPTAPSTDRQKAVARALELGIDVPARATEAQIRARIAEFEATTDPGQKDEDK